ncbi:MAG: hypothetical protein ABSF50_19465 [Burkholderiaceae bacterium]|jgi:hypothetical protein
MDMTFNQQQIFAKTDLGRRTIQHRSLELPRTARTILLLVDGRSTVAKLQQLIAATHAPEKTLHDLESMGLITPVVTANVAHPELLEPVASSHPMSELDRFNGLYEIMCEVSATFLGLRGYFIQLKIEKCATAADLLLLRRELVEAIFKRHGNDIARDIDRRIKELI